MPHTSADGASRGNATSTGWKNDDNTCHCYYDLVTPSRWLLNAGFRLRPAVARIRNADRRTRRKRGGVV